jgi:hypothetical protein
LILLVAEGDKGRPVEAGEASDKEEVVPFVRQRKWGVPRRRLRGRIPSLSSAALRRREFREESYYILLVWGKKSRYKRFYKVTETGSYKIYVAMKTVT